MSPTICVESCLQHRGVTDLDCSWGPIAASVEWPALCPAAAALAHCTSQARAHVPGQADERSNLLQRLGLAETSRSSSVEIEMTNFEHPAASAVQLGVEYAGSRDGALSAVAHGNTDVHAGNKCLLKDSAGSRQDKGCSVLFCLEVPCILAQLLDV